MNFKTHLPAARALREEFRAHGEFTTDDHREALASRLGLPWSEAEAIAKAIDRESIFLFLRPNRQEFDLDGEYALDDVRRVSRRGAKLAQAEEGLAYMELLMAQVIVPRN